MGLMYTGVKPTEPGNRPSLVAAGHVSMFQNYNSKGNQYKEKNYLERLELFAIIALLGQRMSLI